MVLAASARLGAVRLVAIDGPSGSGKSTLAAGLVTALAGRGVRAAVVPTDHFATWADPVSWWPRLVDERADAAEPGRDRALSAHDWSGGTPRPGDEVEVAVPEVLVVEGVSAGRRSVRPL